MIGHHDIAIARELVPQAKFYFAGSSEMIGRTDQCPQTETTPFHPRSTYGISKVAGYHLTRNYREAYRMFACSGILYNHESPRRGFEFVTRKITAQAAKIKLGLESQIHLGNLDACRDWGHAREYIRAMWLMLQQDEPDDYVIATGESHSVREFLELAGSICGLDWKRVVESDPRYLRPSEVDHLCGDASKAMRKLRWRPQVSFEDLVSLMVEHDLELARQEQTLTHAGHTVGLRAVLHG